MKRFAVIVAMLLSAVVVRAQSASEKADESKLLALENAWNLAQVHHDAKAIENLVGEKFIYTDTDGSTMDKAAFLLDVKDPDYKAASVVNDRLKVDIYQNAAVVSGRYHSKGTYKGKWFDHYGRFTDTWILESGQWQCVASHTTLLHK